MRQQRLCISSIKYQPGVHTSDLHLSYTDRNYDSDDSVTCGRKCTEITAWVIKKYLKSLTFLINKTSAQLTLLSIVKNMTESELEPEVVFVSIRRGVNLISMQNIERIQYPKLNQ